MLALLAGNEALATCLSGCAAMSLLRAGRPHMCGWQMLLAWHGAVWQGPQAAEAQQGAGRGAAAACRCTSTTGMPM